eukprot:238038-Pyramimonas_sp.AAC.1
MDWKQLQLDVALCCLYQGDRLDGALIAHVDDVVIARGSAIMRDQGAELKDRSPLGSWTCQEGQRRPLHRPSGQ